MQDNSTKKQRKFSATAGKKRTEKLVKIFLFICAFVSVLTTVGIVWVLFSESLPFFDKVSLKEFFLGTQWYPLFEPKRYGILPLIGGTLMIAIGAAIVALPIGTGSAIYLSEYASSKQRAVLKPFLEILAGIPTVVYGYFALTVITPVIQKIFPSTNIFNAASGAIVVGIMIIPMIASLSDDAMRSVPDSLRNAAFALGGTKLDVSAKVVFPSALSGVVASYVLAISRAIGETMAVTLAAGATPKLTINPLESIQTMTAYIVQVSLGDTPAGSTSYQTVFAVGLTLFLMTFVMNILAQKFLHKFREQYD